MSESAIPSHPFAGVPNRLGAGTWARSLHFVGSTGSTNSDATEAASLGAPSGHVVVADAQSAGRGRLGRAWIAVDGLDLLVSFVVRPDFRVERWPWIPLAASVAVVDAVRSVAPDLEPRVKWPNDVRIAGQKAAGILAESRLDSTGKGFVVVGIGLNVNRTVFEDELRETATSIALAAGRTFRRDEILGALADALERRVGMIRAELPFLAKSYRVLLEGVGSSVGIRSPADGAVVRGVFEGIDDHGALVLATEEGRRTFSAGEVTLRPV